ncbi:MAG: response regulator transcription factor [Firmicutes bacterium]|nr:response regulator transcription factor [Bacillota bacterium]MBR0481118.1 response regulator transcription factor [Bacillota bacterium]
MQKILLVEDDRTIIRSLKAFLSEEGFDVDSVSTQFEAENHMDEGFSLLLLDISLAQGSGFEVCRKAKGKGIPVIFLTASGDEMSVVKGLDMGADDYIAKPFRPRELVSRIRSTLRRYQPASLITAGNVTVDTDKALVMKNGIEVPLSALEYRLLTVFINNRGLLLSRNKLLEDIWDIVGDFVNDNTLTVYIKRLREKIEDDPQDPQIIKTVRGLGYRMD